jgi:arylsulfatase A-like enzyme
MVVTQPNLVFITTDHQRADSLGAVHCGREVTPRLNQLAAGGTRFTRAYNACPLCVPARTAMATGKCPTSTGVVYNDWEGVTASDHIPLHQHLSHAGYDVAHIGVHHIRVAPELTARVPFSLWQGREEYAAWMRASGMNARPSDPRRFKREITERQDGRWVTATYSNTEVDTWPYDADHFEDAFYTARATEYLGEAHDRPFALFVYLWAPHPPLRVPQPYASMFPPEEIALPANVGVPAAGEPPLRRRSMPAQLAAGVTEAQWRRVWGAHLGLTHMADELVGRILDSVDQRADAADTLVLFSTDHGDHLGQHGMYQKMEMYEQAVRVPLIVSGPQVMPQECHVPVSHLDVLPSLLDAMGVDLHAAAGASGGGDLDGRSLWPYLSTGQEPSEQPVFSQYSGNPSIGAIRRAIVAGAHKYVFDPDDEPELFDLAADPLEEHNLAADRPLEAKELHQMLRHWGEEHRDWVAY